MSYDSIYICQTAYVNRVLNTEIRSKERKEWVMKEASGVLRALSFMAAYHRPGMAHSQWADWRSRQQKRERQAHKRKLSHIHKRCSESERVGGSGPWKPWQDSILMHKQKS